MLNTWFSVMYTPGRRTFPVQGAVLPGLTHSHLSRSGDPIVSFILGLCKPVATVGMQAGQPVHHHCFQNERNT